MAHDPSCRDVATTSSHLVPRRSFSLLLLPLIAALALAGCSNKTDVTRSPKPSVSLTPTEVPSVAAMPPPAPPWPLSGLPSMDPMPRHPVMVVKIDNTVSSSPQIGLHAADLVTEELVEGGSTRLAVFYYQHVPKLVGPVRSMRASDIGIVKPAKAVLVAAGGASPTVRRIRAAKIKTFEEGATGFFREYNRRAPYNLFVDLAKLARRSNPRRLPTTTYRGVMSRICRKGRARLDCPRCSPAYTPPPGSSTAANTRT